MNDLDTLSQLRDDIPPPGADVLAGARAALTDRIAEPVVMSPARQRVPVRRQAWLAGAAAAAVATGAIALTSGGDGARHRTSTGTHQSTAQPPALTPVGYLLDAAKHTIAIGDPVVPPGQYRYVRTHSWSAVIFHGVDDGTHRIGTPPPRQAGAHVLTYLSEEEYEEWVPAGGTGTWYWRYTRPIATKFFSAADKRYVEKNLRQGLVRHVEHYTGTDGQFGSKLPPTWDAPTPAWLAAQPREPAALLARLYADPGKDGEPDKYDAAFSRIAQVLSSGIVPADLRAALYQVATTIPGIVLVDSTANLDGRQGVAVGRATTYGTRQDIIFDSAGGQYIGEREVTTRPGPTPDVPVGSTIASTAVTVGVAAKPPAG
jgi:hypothetical protein